MFVLMKKIFQTLFSILILSLIALETNSEEKIVDNNHEFTFYTGLFDHNHAYGNSSLVGFLPSCDANSSAKAML